jgi:hypothetical protein
MFRYTDQRIYKYLFVEPLATAPLRVLADAEYAKSKNDPPKI